MWFLVFVCLFVCLFVCMGFFGVFFGGGDKFPDVQLVFSTTIYNMNFRVGK